MDKCGSVLLLFAAISLSSAAPVTPQPHIQQVRFWSFEDVTRIVIQTQGTYTLAWDQIENPSRVYFDLAGLRPPATLRKGLERIAINDKRVKEIRIAQVVPGKTRIVFDLFGPAEVQSSQLVNPDRLVIEVRPKGTSIAALAGKHTSSPDPNPPAPLAASLPVPSPPPSAPSLAPVVIPATVTKIPVDIAAPAKTDSAGEKSLVRIFGLKMGKVVIDAGHGGHDTGTIGPNGLMEKDLVLDVALRLGKLINQRLGATVVYTRAGDTFIPLEQRTKIANDEKADLFISIHANSSPEPAATGVETYFFNLTSDKSGLDLATRENAASASSISDLNDLLHRAVLQTKREESRQFAQDVQAALWTESVRMNSKSRDRGVRQAPFVVLIGAGMPSILAEIGFVSNPHDEKLLKRTD